MNYTFSQGLQDLRLQRIFRALHIQRSTFVEFGFPAVHTSNSEALKYRGWTGVRFDGTCLGNPAADADAACHREWVLSDAVVPLLQRHKVLPSVEYISIDLDTIDLWVLRGLLAGGFRPAVLTIEYNSNYPLEYTLAFPDTWHFPGRGSSTYSWDTDCYMGSSAGAIIEVAKEYGYVVVDVEPGLDLFLVDNRRWGARPVHTLSTGSIYRPFNLRTGLRMGRVGLASTPKAAAMLDYPTWRRTNSATAAQRTARDKFTELGTRLDLPCFVDT